VRVLKDNKDLQVHKGLKERQVLKVHKELKEP
jgi:hypothetical protein